MKPDTGPRPPKRVAVVQSSYIPWKGYFDLINSVDEFILYDEVQYTRRDWRNRNRIKTSAGLQWLTIPLAVKGRFDARICDMGVSDESWPAKHWKRIVHSYARAPYFSRYREFFESLYTGLEEKNLSMINFKFLKAVCDFLGSTTPLSWSMDYEFDGDREVGRTDRLVQLCRAAGATTYLSGPSARRYLEEQPFAEAKISLEFADYTEYPEYRQFFGEFEHHVSIIDLLFQTGPEAPHYMKSFGSDYDRHG